ncbi:MAG: ACT domain-containing protein [Ignavibacteria bacterium]|nr:ACT domain-containing protein [Ignavibacteria bacterium]
MELEIVNGTFSIHKVCPDRKDLLDLFNEDFFSITKTNDEISVVCREEIFIKETEVENGWKCLKVKGILDFSLVGIFHSILTELKNAEISVFVISTFNTDYILIKKESFEKAVKVLNMTNNISIK